VKRAIWLSLAVAAIASSALASPVPATVNFTARLIDERSGDPLTGDHHLDFDLFTTPRDGTSLWQENRDLLVEDGLVFLALGSVRPFFPGIFTGQRLYLQVTLDGIVMDPRISIESVPYAIRASDAENADKVGGIPADGLQRRVTGTCGPGSFLTAVNPDGTVTCLPDAVGTGDITGVTAGTGLEGGGAAGDVTLSLLKSCAAGQLLKWNGAGWACADDVDTDTNAGGDITAVTAGTGLEGGGATGDVALSLLKSCAAGQLLKWNGTSWGCANDIDTDTNAGGDITAITAGTGLEGGGATGDVALSLLTTCAAGQLLKWSGTGWACADDVDTDTNAGGDITDVVAGAGLVGGAADGAATIDVGAGTGIAVAANSVSLDLQYTDGRYVNTAGDTMAGALDMNNQRLLNRGCPSGHVRVGPGLCTESIDQVGFTFTGCANRCRVQGTHMCSSGEFRAILASGIGLVSSALLDWMDDQSGDDSALYINSLASAENPEGSRATSTSSWCRCCANVE
jgi:hypothetical protein